MGAKCIIKKVYYKFRKVCPDCGQKGGKLIDKADGEAWLCENCGYYEERG